MQAGNRRLSSWRACAAVALTLLLVLPEAPAYAQRRGGGGGSRSRGSVNSVNRSSPGTGGSWSNPRTSGTTSRTATGSGSSRTTTAQTRSGETATANRNVTKSGDEVTVNRNAQSTSGASKSSQKTYEMDDGRVESVERDVSGHEPLRPDGELGGQGRALRLRLGVRGRGQEPLRAERRGRGLRRARALRRGRGRRRRGRPLRRPDGRRGAGLRGAGPRRAAFPTAPDPTTTTATAYYGYGGAYYRPYTYHGVPYYGYMHPPWGCYYTTVPVGAIALTIAGMAMLYSDGTYYKTTYVEGATQYQVVAPPAGATLPAGTTLPADKTAITISGVTYYLYGNTFYKRVVTNGQESFVVVTKPAGLVAVKALPSDFEPMQAGSTVYFRSKGRYYAAYLDPSGEESYLVVDPPAGAVPAVPGEPGAAPKAAAAAAPASAPAAKPRAVTLTVQPNTPLTVRVATEVNSGTAQAGQRFQGNLDTDLVAADGRVVATRGTRVYGRVVAAKAGTGTGGAPQLTLELTDVEVGGRVVALATEPVSYDRRGQEGRQEGPRGGGARRRDRRHDRRRRGGGLGRGRRRGGRGRGRREVVPRQPGGRRRAGTAPSQFRLARPLSVDVVV